EAARKGPKALLEYLRSDAYDQEYYTVRRSPLLFSLLVAPSQPPLSRARSTRRSTRTRTRIALKTRRRRRATRRTARRRARRRRARRTARPRRSREHAGEARLAD